MAALNFPSTPAHLDTYTDPNQAIWQYDSDGPYWNVITSTTRKNFSGVDLVPLLQINLTPTYTTMGFDDPLFQVDTYFNDNSPGTVTVPTTGFYRVALVLFTGTDGSGSSYTFKILKNSAELGEINAGPNQSVSFDQTYSLVAGDQIIVQGKEEAGVGEVTTDSKFTVYRLGFAPGTGISNHNAFSGVRVKLTGDESTTSTPTAVTWGTTDFNVNANVLGDLYWYNAVANRVTVRADGYYKFRSYVMAGTDGSSNSYTITVRKNGTTTLATSSLSANDFIELDEIFYLDEDDFIELMISNSDNTGSISDTSYLELVREGV